MKKGKLLPLLAAACCSFTAMGTAFALTSLRQPAGVGAADTGTLLNSCDSAGTFWCPNGTSVNTNAAYIDEGNGSVCVSTSGWSPINLDWGASNITNYAYVKMTVWSSNPVKLLAGDINFNTDPNCILAELAAGKNEVTNVKLDKLVTILLGDVNDDGKVTVLDLMRLANFFAGKDVEIKEVNTDVNGDGKITVLDLMRLANYFAGKAELG